jgi:hypothetical protein
MCLESNAEGTLLFYEQCYVSEHQAFEWRPTLIGDDAAIQDQATDAMQTSTWEKGLHNQPVGFLYLPVLDKCVKQHGESLVLADCRADLADMKFYLNEHNEIVRSDDGGCVKRRVLGGVSAGVNHHSVEDMFMGASNLLGGSADTSRCTELPALAPYLFKVPDEAQNGEPVINLRGPEEIYLRTNNQMEYVDAGAACSDLSDGSINDRVTVTGDIVDIHTPGTYVTFYNCMNEAGAAAKERSRTVHVVRLIEEYATVPLTPTSDRVCKAATTCTIHEYQSIPMSGTSDRVCSDLGTCESGYYTYKLPTWTSDRVCKKATDCSKLPDFYELYPPTDTSNAKCARMTSCYAYNGPIVAARQYESLPGTATSDRQCLPLTVCDYATAYESTFPTKTTDRVCSLVDNCADFEPPQYESRPASSTSNKICLDYTTCIEGQEYETRPITATSDRQCTRLTSCNKLEVFCLEANSDGSKIYYEECINSDLQAFEWRPSGMASNAPFDVDSTSVWEVDDSGNQVGLLYLPILDKCLHNTGTAVQLMACQDADTMKFYMDESKQILQKNGQGCFKEQMVTHAIYETEINALDVSALAQCTKWNALTSYLFVVPDEPKENDKPVINVKGAQRLTLASADNGEYEDLGAECHDYADGDLTTQSLTVTGDVVKLNCERGPCIYKVKYNCVNSEGVHAETKERVVTVITLQYETAAYTPTSNRECSSASACSSGQYEFMPPVGDKDRICRSITQCNADTYWESLAATATTDAVCTPVTVCLADEYQVSPPTPMADAVCAPMTVCAVPCTDEYEVQKPTLTSDRICRKSTTCTGFEYEVQGCSPVKDTVCKALTVCPADHYASKLPTTTSDRVCNARPAPAITIRGGQYVTLEAERDGGIWADPGAYCTELDNQGNEINLTPSSSGSVYLDTLSPPAQVIKYSCTSSFTHATSKKDRFVSVHDTKCPTCVLRNPQTLVTVEASFPYADTGVQCSDDFSPTTTVTETSDVNVEAVGTYHVTYRAEDAAGNYNDGTTTVANRTCSGGAQTELVRTVVVIDTLRPVIALKYKNQIIGHSGSADHSTTVQSWRNPASHYFHAPEPDADDNFIESYSFKFERGSSPYILPTTPGSPYYIATNPDNLQATAEECKQQCKNIPTCRYGTYITDTAPNSTRTGECWLSAQTSVEDRLCGVGCESFDKVSYTTTGDLMAILSPVQMSAAAAFSIFGTLAAVVVGVVLARRRSQQMPNDAKYERVYIRTQAAAQFNYDGISRNVVATVDI